MEELMRNKPLLIPAKAFPTILTLSAKNSKVLWSKIQKTKLEKQITDDSRLDLSYFFVDT